MGTVPESFAVEVARGNIISTESTASLAPTLATRCTQLLESLSARTALARRGDGQARPIGRDRRRASLAPTRDEFDQALHAAWRAARLAPILPDKLERQREERQVELMRDEAGRGEPTTPRAGRSTAKRVIDIRELRVLRGGLPRRAMALVLEWAAEHRDELMENWNLCRDMQAPKPIEPLK